MGYHNCYCVDLSTISSNRTSGVSGMMRVKNDAEFIESCIESCIEALDELVIVYNDCSDESPAILNRMALKYPDKIRVYEYEPQIYAWNLSDTQINDILNKSIPEENTLAGYYNFALSKTTRSYVMKIDADQIYFTQRLKQICDCFRQDSSTTYVSFFDKALIWGARGYKYLCNKLNIPSTLLNSKLIFQKYISTVFKLVSKYKINVSLSGVNVYIDEYNTYVTLGKNTDTRVNILNPYNGEGDHLIFRVTKDTYFVPAIDKAYASLNGLNTSVIETLLGTGRLWPIGLFWIHLNSCRRKNINTSKVNFRKYPDHFVRIDKFKDRPLYKKYFTCSKSVIDRYRMNNLCLIHNSLDQSFIKFASLWREKIISNLNQI